MSGLARIAVTRSRWPSICVSTPSRHRIGSRCISTDKLADGARIARGALMPDLAVTSPARRRGDRVRRRSPDFLAPRVGDRVDEKPTLLFGFILGLRSEERRVGKGCG